MRLRLSTCAVLTPCRLRSRLRPHSMSSYRTYRPLFCKQSDDRTVSTREMQRTELTTSTALETTAKQERPPRKSPLTQLVENLAVLFSTVKSSISWIGRHPISRVILFSLSIFCVHVFFSMNRGYRVNVLYSEFVKQVEAGKVETVFFESKSNRLRFTYRPEMWDHLRQQTKFKKMTPEQIDQRIRRIQTCSKVVPGQTDSLTQLLKQKNVHYGVTDPSVSSSLGAFVSTMFWLWVPLLPLIYLFKGTLDSKMGGKNKKVKTTAITNVRFSDVAGMEEAKLELLEVVALLKNPEKYAELNAKVPSGVLLCGPTGTGKTLLARAVACEAGVPFFAVSASEFVEMFVGRGAARIRELFREARKHTPCVVFVDEIDSVGGMRGNSFNEERDQTLNQLLVELDGFEDNKSIVLLAATNRFNSLDPALLRPGRLTRKISIPLPDAASRAAILAVHLRDVPMQTLEDKIDACGLLGRVSEGYSGAELANAVNEAALMAAREDRHAVEIQDLIKGLQRTKRPVNLTGGMTGWMQSIESYAWEQLWQQRRPRLIS